MRPGRLHVGTSRSGLPLLRWHSRERLFPFGLRSRHHACCSKRSDQLPQGAPGLPDAARRPFPALVDAAGGDSLDPEEPGLTGADGALCRTEPTGLMRAVRDIFGKSSSDSTINQVGPGAVGRGWL